MNIEVIAASTPQDLNTRVAEAIGRLQKQGHTDFSFQFQTSYDPNTTQMGGVVFSVMIISK